MAIIGYGIWQRGPVTPIFQRFKLLPYQLGRAGGATLAAALVVFACTGSYIYYNTCVLNVCASTSEGYDLQAAYETQYAQYADTPAPRITQVNAKVDIYPEKRLIKASAKVTVVNDSPTPITRFLVSMPDHTSFGRVTLTAASGSDVLTMDKSDPIHSDPLQVYWMSLTKAMQPGEERTATIEVVRSHQGFKDQGVDVQLVRNGTFINNTELFPMFGYQPQRELMDRQQRRERGLPPPRRSNKLEDAAHYNETFMGHASGFIEFEATVSTIVGQTAIAPGYLQAHWTEAGRAYFHYKMDAPIGNYYAFLSARLEIAKADHNGVAIEVYHHPSHDMNVPRMITAVKDSLDYYTANFGPYQHRQARIIEFPGYRRFAQSFANTIPFSETIGFFADLSDPDKLDSAYFVTAHEMAHQWWGGQVDGANVQGSTLLSESLAHYSALRVTQKRYGEAHSRRILNFELDRYLRERTEELIEELPWMRVENQPYIHYRKGIVAMNDVHQILGDERMNRALQGYLADYRFKQAHYPTTLDLKQRLEEDAGETERQDIDDLFSRILLYDLKLMSAEAMENTDGSFDLTIKIDAKRFEVDGQGQMAPLPLDEMVEIGLSDLAPDEITTDEELPRRTSFLITEGENIINLTSKTLPAFALIDPMVRIIDRDTVDNVRAIELITAD
jgi:ABC-2 type transport system permease protein